MAQPRPRKHGPIQQKRDEEAREKGARGGRPPYAGEVVGKKEPPFDVTGTDALSPLLMQIDFPATREDIQERIGDARIAVDSQHTRSVREILDEVGPTEFRSSREVESAVQGNWDVIARRSGRGGRQQKEDNLWQREPN